MAAPFSGDPNPIEAALPGTVALRWTAAGDGGSPILRYDIIARQDGVPDVEGFTDYLEDLSYPLPAAPGQSLVSVYAVNAQGRSAPATTTVTGGTGLTPAHLKVTPVNGGANLTLPIPATGADKYYLILQKPAFTVINPVTFPYSLRGLTAGNNYRVKVGAQQTVNGYTKGVFSNEVEFIASTGGNTIGNYVFEAKSYTFDDPTEAGDWSGPNTTLSVSAGKLIATPSTAGNPGYLIATPAPPLSTTNRFEATFATTDHSGGIIWNFVDANNFWACNNTNIIQRVNGSSSVVANVGFYGAVALEVDPSGDYRLYYSLSANSGAGFTGSMGSAYTSAKAGVWGTGVSLDTAKISSAA